MNRLVTIGILGFLGYLIWKGMQPVAEIAPPSYAPSVGPSYAGNTYPGMRGAMYVTVPGAPGLVMSVTSTAFTG